MAAAIETFRGSVYPWQCDQMGHMNVMWYVGRFDEATWQLFARLGLTRAWLAAHGRGMAAVEQHLHYRRELHAGDVIVVRTRLDETAAKSMRFTHEMFDAVDDGLCASCTLTAVHLDTTARRATPFAPEIVARLQAARAD